MKCVIARCRAASLRDGSPSTLFLPMPDEPTHLDAELDAVLIGGREPGIVRLVDYDLGWPARFDSERARISAALGPLARRIDHIGSTAVPGLAAKPIIDVLVEVDDPEAEQQTRRSWSRWAICCACGSRSTACSARPPATSTCTSGRPAALRPSTTSSCATGCARTPAIAGCMRGQSAPSPTCTGRT